MLTKNHTNNKTMYSFKLDKDLKKDVDSFSDSIGIPVSTMINALLKNLIKTRKFQVVDELIPTGYTKKSIRHYQSEKKAGKLKVSSSKDFLQSLKDLQK